MNINISAEKMLQVLIDSGIDKIDAKAIICDLLLAAGDSDTERPKPRAREALREVVRSRKTSPREETIEAEVEEVQEVQEVQEVESKPVTTEPRRLNKKKRVSFSAFGGQADPLR